jgi:hypothetical protein
MMSWLIRKKSHENSHFILGPIDRVKLLELVRSGQVKGEDEICQGNGYWFFVRERDLFEKYVINQIPQSFNPISEAPTVLSRVESLELVDDENDNDDSGTQVLNLDLINEKLSDTTIKKENKKVKTKISTWKNFFDQKYYVLLIFLLLLLVMFKKVILKSTTFINF